MRLFGLAAVFCSASNLPAQAFGEIAGFVRDASAGAVQGARVSATNESTNQSRTVETSASGSYSIPFLQPGPYTVLAEKQGFKSQLRSGVVLQVEDRARADFLMEIGPVAEIVEVTASAPLIARDSAAIGTVITEQQLVDFPLNGRNYLSLAKISPKVQGADRCLRGGARPRHLANHCDDQIGDK